MKKNSNIQPSIEEAKQRIDLYNKLNNAMRDLSHDEKLQVLMLMTVYMDLQECNQLLEKRLSLVYSQCATLVFNYLYKNGQLKADRVGFDPEIRDRIQKSAVMGYRDIGRIGDLDAILLGKASRFHIHVIDTYSVMIISG